MHLIVVVCAHCRRVQVVEAGRARIHCRGCNRAFDLAGRQAFYRGADPEEARRAAAKLSLEVGGAGIEAMAESAVAAERERVGTLEDVVAALRSRSEFEPTDVDVEVARVKAPVSSDRVLDLLRRENRLFEPRPGRFRWVD